MKKLALVQLGLALALASSSAFALPKPGEVKGRDNRGENVLEGDQVVDPKLRLEGAQLSHETAGTRTELADEQAAERALKSKIAVKATAVEIAQARKVSDKLLPLAKDGKLGDHSADVFKILREPDMSDSAMVGKMDRIASRIQKSRTELLAKCEE